MRSNSSIKGIIYALIVVSLSLTLLQGYIHLFTRLWLIATVGVVMAFFIDRDFIKRKSFAASMLYFLFVILNFMTGDSYFGSVGNVVLEISSLLLVCFMFYGLVKEKDEKNRGIVVYAFFLVILITTVGTFISDSISPGIVRQAFGANVTGSDKEILTLFYRFGMSNYSLPHAIPVLIPGVVFGIKSRIHLKRFVRIILWITLFCLVLLAYLSSSTAALLFTIFSLTISFSLKIGKERTNVRRVVLLMLVASPFLLSKNIQLGILDAADRVAGENIYFHRKISYFQEAITSDNSDIMESRDYLYEMSFESLIGNPILGTNLEIGGHSSILDRFATLGLLGMIPFVLFLIFQFKTTIKKIDRTDTSFYVIGFLMGIMMCCLKSAWYWEMHFAMFVFLPVSIIMFRKLAKAPNREGICQ